MSTTAVKNKYLRDNNMAKKATKKSTKKSSVKKTAKKVVKKVLDKTEVDEMLIAEYNENKSVYDTILCYINCYGAYVLAIGAGCTFGVNNWVAVGLLCITTGWAYWTNCACKPCKGGNTGACCK